MTAFTTRRMRSSASIRAVAVLLVLVACQARAESDDDGWGMDDDLAASVTHGPWAADLNVGPGMNAARRNLRGSRFVCQDLAGAVFDACDLNNVQFFQCDLRKASFKGACLTGTSIDQCDKRGADFTDAVVNGCECRLSEEQLKSTRSYKTKDLRNCRIASYTDMNPETIDFQAQYDFRGAHLENSILCGDLRRCDFADACIDRIKIEYATVAFRQIASTANFKRRKLGYVNLYLNMEGSPDFSGIDLTGTTLFIGRCPQASFDGATITGCTLGSITWNGLKTTKNYREGNLSGITLKQIDLSETDLSRQNLTGAKLAQCNFAGAILSDAVITDTHFSGVAFGDCLGLTVEQIKSTWNYKNGRMAGIILPKDIADALQKEKEVEK